MSRDSTLGARTRAALDKSDSERSFSPNGSLCATVPASRRWEVGQRFGRCFVFVCFVFAYSLLIYDNKGILGFPNRVIILVLTSLA